MVSTMPSAVRGLTKHDAPSAGVGPSGRPSQPAAFITRYCAYIAPRRMATTLPTRACAAGDDPAPTTTPAPSFPTGIGWSTRPATARIISGAIVAVTIGRSALPEALAVVMSAPPNRSPRSDGVVGGAPTRPATPFALPSAHRPPPRHRPTR